jgi:streptogramin lyase
MTWTRRSYAAIAALGILSASLVGARSTYSQYAPGGAAVKGIVKSSDGKAMEGVTVSVRGEGKTFISTVFTDVQGAFLLPRLEKGQYDLWAQAVGFDEARAIVNVADGPTQQGGPLELKPLKDFHTQLSASEWITSLPEADPKDLRMKQALITECTGCHQIGYPLQNRFDAAGWNTIVTMMTKIQGSGGYMPANPKVNPVIEAYREEIVAYLARVRGPDSTLVPKLLPRPTGEAENVLITEFDLPRPEQPDSILTHNGSIWSDGIPSRYSGRAAHDVVPTSDGNAYFSDDVSPVRTIGKIDAKTGKVTDYRVSDKDGNLISTHGIAKAPNGFLWMNAAPLDTFMSFDPETEKFHNYPRPEGTPGIGGNIAVDSKGNVWATTSQGAVKMDPKTGAHTFYKAVSVQGTTTYGITIDSEDKAWFCMPGNDTVGVVDQHGNVSEVKLPRMTEDFFTDKDRELTAKFTAMDLKSGGEWGPVSSKGPRRLAADPKGNYVWVSDTWANQVERIDIHTKEVKEYTMLHRWSEPYSAAVDKNHMVYINMLGRDAFAKLDPNTGQITEFQLPSRGTETRWISTDNNADPTIWVSYNRINRVARIQYRKASELQSDLQ